MSFLTNIIQLFLFTYIENLEGFDTGVKMGPARDLAIVDCVGLEPEIMVIAQSRTRRDLIFIYHTHWPRSAPK